MNHIDAILSGDIHLRLSPPLCRNDNFLDTEVKKLRWLRNLQQEHDCHVFDSGDLFSYWKTSPELLSFAFAHLPSRFITIPGNHDLPENNVGQLNRSGLACLAAAGKIQLLSESHTVILSCHSEPNILVIGTGWGIAPDKKQLEMAEAFEGRTVLILHHMIFKGRKAHWAKPSDLTARKVLRTYPQFDLILTGHHHKSFIDEYQGSLLVNPGSMTRQKSSETSHEPCVFLWNAESNTVEKARYPIKQGVISKTQETEERERKEGISIFVTRLKNPESVELSYTENMEGFIDKNEISKPIQRFIYQAMEEA